MGPAQNVRENPHTLPWKTWNIIHQLLEAMLDLGVVEVSYSEWRSPIVLVSKPDRTVHFCIDLRQVNTVSKFNAYPMPWVAELLGMAEYIFTLDLTKGYWLIPFIPNCREKNSFFTPFRLYQFYTMPFKQLQPSRDWWIKSCDPVGCMLQPIWMILSHTGRVGETTWNSHSVTHWRRVNGQYSKTGNCEATYLGHTVRGGQLWPLVDKVHTLVSCLSLQWKNKCDDS